MTMQIKVYLISIGQISFGNFSLEKICNYNCLIARLSISSMLAQSIKGVISEFDKNSKWLHNLQEGYQVFVFIENCGIYQISTLNSETGLINLKCIRRPSAEVIDLSRCFIIMSMDSEKPELIDVWESLKESIKNTGDKFGIDVSAKRIDDFKGQTHKIDSKVFEEIEKSGIIIADLSGERPNCYLEVGYALARQRKLILTAKKGVKIHFDISSYKINFWANLKELRDMVDMDANAIFEAAK